MRDNFPTIYLSILLKYFNVQYVTYIWHKSKFIQMILEPVPSAEWCLSFSVKTMNSDIKPTK